MAKRIEGFDEAILACAKQEFLENGYEAASLRTIAKNAGVSTSTIYTRYGGKEGLFRALVSPAAEKLLLYMQTYLSAFEGLDPGTQIGRRMDCTARGCSGFLDILYGNFDEFRLMVTSSTNNLYHYYLGKIIALEEQSTIRFLQLTENQAYARGIITDGFIHIVSSGFCSGIFEIAVQNISREEGEKYIQELILFYNNGWMRYL